MNNMIVVKSPKVRRDPDHVQCKQRIVIQTQYGYPSGNATHRWPSSEMTNFASRPGSQLSREAMGSQPRHVMEPPRVRDDSRVEQNGRGRIEYSQPEKVSHRKPPPRLPSHFPVLDSRYPRTTSGTWRQPGTDSTGRARSNPSPWSVYNGPSPPSRMQQPPPSDGAYHWTRTAPASRAIASEQGGTGIPLYSSHTAPGSGWPTWSSTIHHGPPIARVIPQTSSPLVVAPPPIVIKQNGFVANSKHRIDTDIDSPTLHDHHQMITNKKAKNNDLDMLDLLCQATLEIGPMHDNPTGCTCPKSKCIALYCDCFKAGRRCNPQSCGCVDCKNTVQESGPNGARTKAIRSILARNPRAFVTAGVGAAAKPANTDEMGCNCIRSRCLKLYCPCFRKGKACTASCTCVGCSNIDTNPQQGNHHHHHCDERQLAIQLCLDKRPDAFVTRVRETGLGCACKNNRCIRKYCECFRTGLKCTKRCSCVNCENQCTESDDE